MADNENEFTATMEDDLAILPDGWGEGDDIFNVDSWGKDASADESEDSNGQQDLNDIFAEANTDEGTTTADEDDSEDSPETEEPTTQDGPGKLKFQATIDHETSTRKHRQQTEHRPGWQRPSPSMSRRCVQRRSSAMRRRRRC